MCEEGEEREAEVQGESPKTEVGEVEACGWETEMLRQWTGKGHLGVCMEGNS